MLSNAYFLAKFRFDTAENEPAKNLQNFRKMHFRKMHFRKMHFRKMHFRQVPDPKQPCQDGSRHAGDGPSLEVLPTVPQGPDFGEKSYFARRQEVSEKEEKRSKVQDRRTYILNY